MDLTAVTAAAPPAAIVKISGVPVMTYQPLPVDQVEGIHVLAVRDYCFAARLVEVPAHPADRHQIWKRVDWVGHHAIDCHGQALFAVLNPRTGYAIRNDGSLKKVRVVQELLDESVLFVDAGGGVMAKPKGITRRIM